jgi:tetratricopeptide (TPR) repeat protein
MRRLHIALAFALASSSLPAFAAQTQLPAETKGDPKPDTLAAENFLKRQRYEDAIRQAKLALGRDERYVPAMVVLAKAYYYERKYELATSIIDIAKSIDANNAECYNLLGFIALTRDDKISATAAFKKATELNPSYGNAWDNLAAQYLFAKNYDGALEAAQKATQLNATYADAYFNLGILYLDAKQMPGTDVITKLNTAINYLNKYKQLAGYRLTKDDPADTYIAEARTDIDREQKRLQRLERQKQRGEPKPAPSSSGKVQDK